MRLTHDGLLTLSSGTGVNEFSTDGTLAGNSDDALPTEQAVKTYVDAQVATSVDNDWTEGTDVVYNTTDNIGIGTSSPSYPLHVYSSSSKTNTRGIYNSHNSTHSSTGYGIYTYNNMNTTGYKYGIYNSVSSTGTGGRTGIYNYVYGNSGGTATNYGIRTYLNNAGSGINYGLYQSNSSSGTGTKYGIYNNVSSAGTGGRYGIRNDVYGNSGGTGVNYGIRSYLNNAGSGTNYGFYLYSYNTGNGTNYGLYINNASTGTGNEYGIYSTGEDYNYFGGNVGIGISIPTQKLHVSGSMRLTGALYDVNNSAGTSGQILSTTGSGTDWVDASNFGDNLGNHTATTTLNVNDRDVHSVREMEFKDYDDNTGGTNNKYRMLARDGAIQFYDGGVVVGNYTNSTWLDLANGYLVVENRVGIVTTDPDYGLDVEGSSRVSPGGFPATTSPISYYPLYLMATDVISKDGIYDWVNNYGSNDGYITFKDDVSQSFIVPNGYKAVGIYFNFQNAPSTLYIRTATVSTTGNSDLVRTTDYAPENTSPGVFWFNNCSSSTWGNSNCGVSSGGGRYVNIHFDVATATTFNYSGGIVLLVRD